MARSSSTALAAAATSPLPPSRSTTWAGSRSSPARSTTRRQRLTESVVIARSLGLDSLAASGSRALAEVAIRRGALLRALGYAEQAVILSMGQDDLEACAATLLLVAAEAGRAGLDDVATPANAGAAEIYRLLERDDLAQVLSGTASSSAPGTDARTDRLEAGLEAARSVVDPNAAGDRA